MDVREWCYMGNGVHTVVHGCCLKIHSGKSYAVYRLTKEEYDNVVKDYIEHSGGLDEEEIAMVDHSLPGDWFVWVDW